jgi:hypothetical protein
LGQFTRIAATEVTSNQNPTAGNRSKQELDAAADEALAAARSMPSGPEKIEALKRAGLLRKAADDAGISFAKIGRPRK